MIYILLVISTVWGGQVVAMQEFADKVACSQAAAWFKSAEAEQVHTACMPKSVLLKDK